MTVAPRDVAIPGFDAVPLQATYYDPGTRGPAVIIFRNCDRDRSSLDPFATRLSARGVHVITWDYRSGQAKGMDRRGTRIWDADAVFAWLAAQPKVDAKRVVAIGGSCGVSLALDFTGRHAAEVRGVVILSGPSDSAHRSFIARTPGLAVFGGASQAEGAAVPYIDSVVTSSRNPNSRMVAPADGGHGTEMLTRTGEFEATVVSWILRSLGPRSLGPSSS